MNSHAPNESQTDLNRILEIIGRIGNKSENGDYIYRGEPECYPKVSSTLYRKLEESKIEQPERIVEQVQEAELAEAKNYTYEANQFELLTQLQHFGGKTNLIDFTTDYCIALFFACDGYPSENGRIILQDKNGAIKNWIKEPRNSGAGSRPDAQKSIFVRLPEGFIEPNKDDIVKIPKDLKGPLLEYLEKEFGISTAKIYHDIHGFIRSQDLIALFFACDGYPSENGRIILQDKNGAIKNWIKEPRNSGAGSRPDAQKSIFVRLPEGFIEPNKDDIVKIPKDLKGPLLEYLEKEFGISTAKIYHDIHGFIRSQDLRWGANTEYNLGIIYQNRRDKADNSQEKTQYNQKAIEHFTNAIKLKPDFAETYKNRGVAYDFKGDYDRAIEDYSTMIKLTPNDAAAYNNRGNTCLNKGDYPHAIEDYTQAIKLNRRFAEAYNNRGTTYVQTGAIDSAIKNFDKAIELKNDYANAYYNRGVVYGSQDNYERAISDYTQAIELKNDYTEAYNSRGRIYHKKGEIKRAISDYTQAIELKNDYAIAYVSRGVAKRDLERIREAKQDLQTALTFVEQAGDEPLKTKIEAAIRDLD